MPEQYPECSFSIMVARTDCLFLEQTIPHLVRACNYPFTEKVAFIDTAPLGRRFAGRFGIGTDAELRQSVAQLIEGGHLDRAVDISYDRNLRKTVYKQTFGRNLWEVQDSGGYPILGLIQSFDNLAGDYVLHLDIDLLCHGSPEGSWVAEGIRTLEANDDLVFVAPLSGPPSLDGRLHQGATEYRHDADRDLYLFQDVTSRKILFRRETYEALLPMRPLWTSPRRRLVSQFIRKSELWNWEIIVSERLRETGKFRADLSGKFGWTLHTPDHGPRFIECLPELIERVETGDVPDGQRGYYDLDLDLW